MNVRKDSRLKRLPPSRVMASGPALYFDKRHANEVAEMLVSDKESDRGCVIFSAAILEDGLEQLLRAICRTDDPSVDRIVDSLFQTYAPFSTFSAKIHVTYALGLIPKDLREILDLIRKIRNDFAHKKGSVTFQTPECQPRLQALRKAMDPDSYPIGPRPNDNVLVPAMGNITRHRAVDRLSFCLRIANISGRISAASERARRLSRERAQKEPTTSPRPKRRN